MHISPSKTIHYQINQYHSNSIVITSTITSYFPMFDIKSLKNYNSICHNQIHTYCTPLIKFWIWLQIVRKQANCFLNANHTSTRIEFLLIFVRTRFRWLKFLFKVPRGPVTAILLPFNSMVTEIENNPDRFMDCTENGNISTCNNLKKSNK